MTVAQCTELPQRSRSSATELSPEREHDALNETATMSNHGLQETPAIASGPCDRSVDPFEIPPINTFRHAYTQTSDFVPSINSRPSHAEQVEKTGATATQASNHTQRVQFEEFTKQLRQQQYFENRKYSLQQRKRVLQKTITLSARLHRVSSWVGDGLVEISEQADATGFVRVHQHFQNLIDISYSQWDHELHALDPLGSPSASALEPAGSSDLLSKLSNGAQADLFDLLSYLRGNPRFLVDRFKVLTPSQITSLWNPPRFKRFPVKGESAYGPFAHSRGRLSQQRIQSFSKSLEDYASSFERSNPLSLLLFNIYGTNQSSTDPENQLRLSTWSTVCAELMQTSIDAYEALIMPLLDRFASLYEWRAKDSVEMFLMDVLQRGSFLLDHTLSSGDHRRYLGYDPLKTPQAREFFSTAVEELLTIFVRHDGGFPTGALQFASAVLGKLPLLDQQKEFRGMFLHTWFVGYFLQNVINYPENENMLLKFHVSKHARQKILHQLWLALRDHVFDANNERAIPPADPYLRDCVNRMAGTIDSVESLNPYSKTEQTHQEQAANVEASITISVSEIVHMLEALSPQAMHSVGSIDQLVRTTTTAFAYGQYAHYNERFDRLKNDLICLQEPGSSTIDAHPCQENWLQIEIDVAGRPKSPQSSQPPCASLQNIRTLGLDGAQQGALRVYTDQVSDTTILNGVNYRSNLLRSPSLETLFREMANYASSKLDLVGSRYWKKAIDVLHEKYPLSRLIQDDSLVLQSMFENSRLTQAKYQECCSKLEVHLSKMEDICMRIRSTINKAIERFESLRLKVWYAVDVVLSKQYDDAKNIARALNNMATSTIRNYGSNHNSSLVNGRPMSSRSSVSSTFEQPFRDTMNMMKAPSMHGGPKKLSDQQIELTKNWLKETHIENFCKGEERIHRFCMEIYTVSKNLVKETLTENPVLWGSDLFTRERGLFDIRTFSITSAPASTRPASIVSDTMSTSYRSSRYAGRSAESLRMALPEDRRSNVPSRINRDFLPPDLASSLGSLSRAHSATTAESTSSVFSPLPSNARSLTSASIYSRSASIYNDPSLNRFMDTARGKTKFLEKVRQALVCLLLSDLGSPVWSLGSETDAVLESSRDEAAVDARLHNRIVAEALADETNTKHSLLTKARHHSRSRSVTLPLAETRVPTIHADLPNNIQDRALDDSTEDHLMDLSDLLIKLSQQVDPLEKIAVAEEFYDLSLTMLEPDSHYRQDGLSEHRLTRNSLRRCSLDDHASHSTSLHQTEGDHSIEVEEDVPHSFSAHKIIQHLKSDLTKLRPKTLFRDLQYISAFVPSDHIDNSTRGKALLQLSLAALAYKDEVCRSMVDVADRMFTENRHRNSQPVMQKISQFWMSAAREGNAVAQRELAMLYLSRPEDLPIMSLPLSKPSQIFQPDMLWHERNSYKMNAEALCLALHWMQQASENGDRLAKQKLEERRGGIFIR